MYQGRAGPARGDQHGLGRRVTVVTLLAAPPAAPGALALSIHLGAASLTKWAGGVSGPHAADESVRGALRLAGAATGQRRRGGFIPDPLALPRPSPAGEQILRGPRPRGSGRPPAGGESRAVEAPGGAALASAPLAP